LKIKNLLDDLQEEQEIWEDWKKMTSHNWHSVRRPGGGEIKMMKTKKNGSSPFFLIHMKS
jgi:hypothetical protein